MTRTLSARLSHARRRIASALLLGYLAVSAGCRPHLFDELAQSPTEAADGGHVITDDSSSTEADDAAVEGDANDSSDAESAAECLDTRADPNHCGQCGFSCSANFAVPACIDGHCSRCDLQHGDCNEDLAQGPAGNGCETRTDNDTKNCGGCGVRCIASKYGFATCHDGACNEQTVKLTAVVAGVQLGGSGGDVFAASQLCPSGDVLIGISGVGDTIAYSLSAHCGRVALSRTATGYAVKVVPTSATSAVGGNITPPPAPYSRLCGSGEVVSAVAGALWIWPNASDYSVRQLSLTCALVSVDEERRLVLTPRAALLTIGDDKPTNVSRFAQPCGSEGAVAGFTGRNGNYLDAIAVHCGKLTIEEEVGMSTSSPI